MKVDFYLLALSKLSSRDIFYFPFIIWNGNIIFNEDLNITNILQFKKRDLRENMLISFYHELTNKDRYNIKIKPDIDNDFKKFILSKGLIYKISDIDINPIGKELFYYILSGTDSNKNPKTKILIFQEDEKGDLKQLTAASDPNRKSFNDYDLQSKYKIIYFDRFHGKSDDNELNLSHSTSKINLENMINVNKEYMDQIYITLGQIDNIKSVDNDFLYRILNVYTRNFTTGLLPLDIEILSRLNYKELIETAKTDVTFKKTINTNEFLIGYFTLHFPPEHDSGGKRDVSEGNIHGYPTDLIATKPINESYIEFFTNIVPVLELGVTLQTNRFENNELVSVRGIFVEPTKKLVEMGYIESLKYLLKYDFEKYKNISYNIQELELFISFKDISIIKYVLDNFDSKFIDQLDDHFFVNVYKYAIQSHNLEIFKLIENKFPIQDDMFYKVVDFSIYTNNRELINYVYKKYLK